VIVMLGARLGVGGVGFTAEVGAVGKRACALVGFGLFRVSYVVVRFALAFSEFFCLWYFFPRASQAGTDIIYSAWRLGRLGGHWQGLWGGESD